jgi:hypothetical protein
MADRIRATLQNLSPKNREALLLREIQGLSYAEIGEVMSIDSAYVKTLMHRARTQFQEAYGIRLLLEEPSEDCAEISQLLDAMHDGEALLDKERFVKQHLKDCKACQERRRWLVTQSGILGALAPVIPPPGLQERILESMGVSRHLRKIRIQQQIRRMLLGAGAVGLVGIATLTLFLLFRGSPPSTDNTPPPTSAYETPSPAPNQPEGGGPATGEMTDPSASASATSEIASPSPTPSITLTAIDTKTPIPTATLTPTLTPTPTPMPGTIGGYVWKDSNSDGSKQGGEAWYPSVTVYLGQGACLSTGYRTAVSAGDGSFSFANLPAGNYCVSVNLPLVCDTYSSPTTATQFTVALAAGQSLNFAFGFNTFPC